MQFFKRLTRLRTKIKWIGVIILVGIFAEAAPEKARGDQATDLASFVNPFIGTDSGGDTYPGAGAPFGLVQMNPNWEDNGYYYTDDWMHGFVVNSLSGDGGANEGEVLMTATTGPVKIDPASTDYAFDHQHESASAGYYQVMMQPWNINAELTSTPRCGCVRFTFPAGQQANILLPLSYANTKTLSSHVKFVNDRTVSGDVTCRAFNGRHEGITAYFVMKFSHPFALHGTWTGETKHDNSLSATQDTEGTVIGFYGSYPPPASSAEVIVRIGVSYVDGAGALANLKAEMPDDDFDRYHQQTRALWNKELSVIETEGGTVTHNRVFYTALYHCLLSPLIFDDIDGRYRGFDEKIHHVPEGHHFYANFSGWDIYRSEMPLLALIAPQRVEDMAQSLVEEYKQIGYIDRWSELNRATAIMNGDPLTIVLVHVWNAGLRHFDIATAYEAMLKEAQPGKSQHRLTTYELYDEETNGLTFRPEDSPSSALEHENAFAASGNLAAALNKPEADFLHQRALQYRSLYNPASGFLERHNPDGTWDETTKEFTEGNKWIYRWFVPFDVQGLVNMMGGTPVFEARLDAFFKGIPDRRGSTRYDPTNEPDLQAPFLYDYINRPWKTQRLVAETADKMFTDTPGGLAGGGNDDLGTMSAWYILTQLGFYPVDPGYPSFETCTPRFEKIVIHLSPPWVGKEFVIQAAGAAPGNDYIQSSVLNGKPLMNAWFNENEITQGGTWDVTTSSTPNKDNDSLPYDPPHSLSTGFARQPANPGPISAATIVPTSEDAPQTWSYTTDKPADDWMSSSFNDSSWKNGPAGFGTEDENVTPRTPWKTDDIWMRRPFDLPASAKNLAVMAYHDQGIQVYINGALVGESTDWIHDYEDFTIGADVGKKLQPTGNLLAIHVNHPGDGRHFSDAGIEEPP